MILKPLADPNIKIGNTIVTFLQRKVLRGSTIKSAHPFNNMRFKHKMLSLLVQNSGKLCVFLYYKSKNIEFSPVKMIKSQSSTLSICFCCKTNLTMANFRCRYNRSAKLEKILRCME